MLAGDYDRLTYDELRDLCRRRGYSRRDPKAVLKSRLFTINAFERKRNRSMADGANTSGATPPNQGKRRRADDLFLALVEEKEIVMDHAQRWGLETKAHWNANDASSVNGADFAISASTADEREKA